MFSRSSQYILLLLTALLAFTAACGGSLPRYARSIGSGPTARSLQKRAGSGRGGCSDQHVPAEAAISRRGLVKRTFEEFPSEDADKDKFMVDNVAAAESILVAGPPDPDEEGATLNRNTAFFRELGDDGFSLGVTPLTGCVQLAVMSEKGVYFAHFWESESFPLELEEDDGTSDFDGQVVALLNDGLSEDFAEGAPDFNKQEALKAHADSFKDAPGLVAYIMSPFREEDDNPDNNGKELYEKSVGTIIDIVNEITGADTQRVKYPLGKVADTTNFAWGKALYQYDPSAADDQRGFRLITEYQEQEPHTWDD